MATGGYQGYLAMTQVRASAAAVTAQRIDILSPEYGLLAVSAPEAGGVLAPGGVVAIVSAPQIEAELASVLPEQTAPGDGLGATPTTDASGRVRALQRRIDALTLRARCTCRVL